MTKKLTKPPSRTLHYFALAGHLSYCCVIFGVGLILCMTIIGIPIGFPMMVGAGLPIAAETQRYLRAKAQWEHQQLGAEKYRTGPGKAGAPQSKLESDLEYEYDPSLDKMVPIEKPWNEE